MYEIIQILGISSMDKAPLKELLTQPKSNQNVNEQMNLFSDWILIHQYEKEIVNLLFMRSSERTTTWFPLNLKISFFAIREQPSV